MRLITLAKMGVSMATILAVTKFSPVVANEASVQSFALQNDEIHLTVNLEPGTDYIALRRRTAIDQYGDVWISSPVPSQAIQATFTLPTMGDRFFLVIDNGHGEVPAGILPLAGHIEFDVADFISEPMDEASRPYHTLNRLAYGPTMRELDQIESIGLSEFIRRQLNPTEIEEDDLRLEELYKFIYEPYRPGRDTTIIPRGADLRYFKGIERIDSRWKLVDFDDTVSGWRSGRTPIGRAFPDLGTRLQDMQQRDGVPGYLAVFLRFEFEVEDPAATQNLILRNLYDDGFVAFLNGDEVARDNVSGRTPSQYITANDDLRYPRWREFYLDPSDYQLHPGKNVLAVQLHNSRRNDGNSLMDTTLISRDYQPEFERNELTEFPQLQDLLHVRGIYSRRQLQAVMGEFWENHFTTDYDKVAQYFDDLETLDGRDAIPYERAHHEAVNVELREYEFFHENALGNFGDLLLHSATSPAQLIYLDNVINRVGEPNENYAREILELFAFGVDNRYTQRDIEELSRAFTGWQVRKMHPADLPAWPDSALNPPTTQSLEPVDTPIFTRDSGWKYFSGTRAPSRSNGTQTLAWTTPTFRDTTWQSARTPLGYNLNDDSIQSRIKTDVERMNGHFSTIYLRRKFSIENPGELPSLLLEIDYDDGYIAFFNGVEIARSENMENAGKIANYRYRPPEKHLASQRTEYVDLTRLIRRLRPAPAENVLAIEVHNSSLIDTSFYADAAFVSRTRGPGSIDVDDPNGQWTFRFNPDDHDFGEKVLFEGTEHEYRVPAGRSGAEGLRDAVDLIQSMISHPSTSEFICLKLVNRFVSDEISLRTYKDRSANPGLLDVMDRMIAAWHETQPAGNIAHVLETLFSTERPNNYFWAEDNHLAKVKTPIEYINGIVRVLDWGIRPDRLPGANEAMGMHFFNRDDPDGWSEKGFDWMNTGGMLKRLTFASSMPRLSGNDFLRRWSVRRFLLENELETADEIINYFNHVVFEDELTPAERNIFIRFVRLRSNGRTGSFLPSQSDYLSRAGDLMGLILSNPSLQFQ